ncbi:MAG: hypothetical protein Ct9H300mP23_07120 [Nitrospinota bacterium]|nr:MAG: hypothetical protein Ct9H300mP23_07120 [Nitrospinota bacterium]
MAIEQAQERGFLGENILGSGFSINVRVHEGLEVFIGGESTALMQSVEGKRPFPKRNRLTLHNKGCGANQRY